MSIRFWGLKNCDSCRAALKAIANAGIEVDVSDVRNDVMPADLLSRILVAHGADQVINRRSTTWRGLDEAARNSDPVALLQAHPALMKRPLILLENGDSYVGWTPQAKAALGLEQG